MAPTIKTEASIQKTDRKRGKEPRGHSTEYKRDKLIDKVRNARPMRNGVPYDPEALVAEYERAMDVKIVNKDTDASLYSVGKVIDDVWHLHLEDMSDFRVFCNGVAVAHRHSGAADTAAENVERLGRLARFRKVYTRMYGHPPPDQYYGEGGNPPHPSGPVGGIPFQKQNWGGGVYRQPPYPLLGTVHYCTGPWPVHCRMILTERPFRAATQK